ncbi:MAG: hypothetical protein PHI49_06090 [Halothiobacillaceae bacterium]|nr:hypothetical protein [Halothiobacillaceae bacterium]
MISAEPALHGGVVAGLRARASGRTPILMNIEKPHPCGLSRTFVAETPRRTHAFQLIARLCGATFLRRPLILPIFFADASCACERPSCVFPAAGFCSDGIFP